MFKNTSFLLATLQYLYIYTSKPKLQTKINKLSSNFVIQRTEISETRNAALPEKPDGDKTMKKILSQYFHQYYVNKLSITSS